MTANGEMATDSKKLTIILKIPARSFTGKIVVFSIDELQRAQTGINRFKTEWNDMSRIFVVRLALVFVFFLW